MDQMDLARWRGQIDAKCAQVMRQIEAYDTSCGKCRSEVNGKIDTLQLLLVGKIDAIHSRVNSLSNRVFWILGGAVGIGSAVGLIIGLYLLWGK